MRTQRCLIGSLGKAQGGLRHDGAEGSQCLASAAQRRRPGRLRRERRGTGSPEDREDSVFIIGHPASDRYPLTSLLRNPTLRSVSLSRGSERPNRRAPAALRFCIVAEATLSARLLLSPRSGSDTGLNDACAGGKGGMRKQDGPRPPRRPKNTSGFPLLPRRRNRRGGSP